MDSKNGKTIPFISSGEGLIEKAIEAHAYEAEGVWLRRELCARVWAEEYESTRATYPSLGELHVASRVECRMQSLRERIGQIDRRFRNFQLLLAND